MAPSTSPDGLGGLVARLIGNCPSGYYYRNGYCYRNSGWYFWGRWVFAGIVIAFIIGALVLLGCINSRRRRKRGLAPRYGTGWMAPANKFGPGPGNNNGAYVPPPPQYTPQYNMGNYPPQGQQQQPQYTGQTFNSNDGYYGQQGGQQEGVAQPPQAYYGQQQRGVGGEDVYSPPAGPPPGKH